MDIPHKNDEQKPQTSPPDSITNPTTTNPNFPTNNAATATVSASLLTSPTSSVASSSYYQTPPTSPNKSSPVNENVVSPFASTQAAQAAKPITFDIYQTPLMGYHASDSPSNSLQITSSPPSLSTCNPLPPSSSSDGTNPNHSSLPSPLRSSSMPNPRPDLLFHVPQKRSYIEKTFHPKVLNPFDDYSAFLGYTTRGSSPPPANYPMSESPVTMAKVNPSQSTPAASGDITAYTRPPPGSDLVASQEGTDYVEEDFEHYVPEEFEVRRTLSLKSSRTPPGTPFAKGAKKVVRFADSLGLDLEVVRMYPDMDQPPQMENIASEAMKAMGEHKPQGSILTQTPPPTVTPEPGSPVGSPNFPFPPSASSKPSPVSVKGSTIPSPALSKQNSHDSPVFDSTRMHLITRTGSLSTASSTGLQTHRKKHLYPAPKGIDSTLGMPEELTPAEMTALSKFPKEYDYSPPIGSYQPGSGVAIISSPMLPFFPFGDYIYQGIENMTVKSMSPTTAHPTKSSSIASSQPHSTKHLFFSPYDHLSFPTRHINLRIGSAMSGKYLAPTFPQPGKAYNFLKRVRDQKVCLEEVTVRSEKCKISGLVRVENIAFHKTVYIRYTIDDWITQSDHLCTYIPGSTTTSPIYPACAPGGQDSSEAAQRAPQNLDNADASKNSEMICTDKFTFDVVIPFSFSLGSDLYLAVLYRTNGKEYWDNNYGRNYQLKCYAAPSSNPTSPEESSSDMKKHSSIRKS